MSKDISKKIVTKQADDILQVKNHQKGLLAPIEKVFSLTPWNRCPSNPGTGSWASRTKNLYGYRGPHLSGWRSRAAVFSHPDSYISPESREINQQNHHNSKRKAQVFNENIRSHWRIENNLHWMPNVLFKEDAGRKQKGYGGGKTLVLSAKWCSQ
ncbi:MAG: hypothetical protein AAGC64_02060 [Bacteroidota bacterium]